MTDRWRWRWRCGCHVEQKVEEEEVYIRILTQSLSLRLVLNCTNRYRNFRTLTTPTPVQFTCLAVDSSGEIVCAGALDPFNIYVWSLQTGERVHVCVVNCTAVLCYVHILSVICPLPSLFLHSFFLDYSDRHLY